MNILIVSPFFSIDSSKSRPGFLANILLAAGHKVEVVTSDFDHVSKVKIQRVGSNVSINYLKTLPYTKNTSIARFASHFFLTILFFWHVKKNIQTYDLIYVTAPFALTALALSYVCKEKVIIDIVDNWPDSLPFPKSIKKLMFPMFYAWRYLNKLASQRAHKVISLSSTFLQEVNRYKDESHILLGCKKQSRNVRLDGPINILYIGNIGSLYDFETLVNAIFLSGLNMTLHVVGDGDKRGYLLAKLDEMKIKYFYYGIVYEQNVIESIVEKCDVGFNGFSNSTASFSYKCLMYFSYSLPIINSMKGDLWGYVLNNRLGFNYEDKNVLSLTDALVCIEQANRFELAKNVSNFFDSNLEMSVIESKLLKVLKC